MNLLHTFLIIGHIIGVAIGAGSPTSPRFWAKMTIVLIASLNGFVMHRLLFPIFARCAREKTAIGSAEFIRYAPLLVIAGPVSAISWYAALILGAWRSLRLSYWQYITVYGFLVTASITISAFALDYVMANPDRMTRFLPRKWVSAFQTAKTPQRYPAVLIEVRADE